MKATIERAALLKSLGHVQSVVERRNTIPILSNVLIEAGENGTIRFMATDLDLQIVDEAEAAIDQPGTTTVSAHTLFEIVRKLPEGSQVSLSAAEGRLHIAASRYKSNLPTLPRDDFPIIAEGELPTSFELPAAKLRQIIDKTRFAISTEETRYYLNGIFMHVADDVLKAAATDGHRLARVTIARPEGAQGMPDIIVPRKCIGELRKLLDEVEGSVAVSLSASKIRFTLGHAVLTSKLVDQLRRHLPRLQPCHPDRQRQATDYRPQKLPAGRRPRGDDRQRKNACGENGTRPRQDHAVGDQSRERYRNRGGARRLQRGGLRNRVQREISVRHPEPDRIGYGRSASSRRRRADADPRERQGRGALRADADAGVIG
jgi:DNA polymerase III sliding clamp (beta) subunit (PCNA family)